MYRDNELIPIKRLQNRRIGMAKTIVPNTEVKVATLQKSLDKPETK